MLARDLSQGGARLLVERQLQLQDPVQLTIAVPPAAEVVVHAKVVDVKPPSGERKMWSIGVAFDPLHDSVVVDLNNLFEKISLSKKNAAGLLKSAHRTDFRELHSG